MNSKEQFTEAMFFLAEVTGKDLTDLMFNFYYKEFEHEIDKTTNIILSFAKDAKWPSINQIKEKMGLSANEPDDESKARLLMARVDLARRDIGCPIPPSAIAAEKWFGEEDWKIITRYASWAEICDVLTVDRPFYDAQMRGFIKAHFANSKYQAHLSLTNKISGLIDINSLSRDLT